MPVVWHSSPSPSIAVLFLALVQIQQTPFKDIDVFLSWNQIIGIDNPITKEEAPQLCTLKSGFFSRQ
jgi:hypothetical protein